MKNDYARVQCLASGYASWFNNPPLPHRYPLNKYQTQQLSDLGDERDRRLWFQPVSHTRWSSSFTHCSPSWCRSGVWSLCASGCRWWPLGWSSPRPRTSGPGWCCSHSTAGPGLQGTHTHNLLGRILKPPWSLCCYCRAVEETARGQGSACTTGRRSTHDPWWPPRAPRNAATTTSIRLQFHIGTKKHLEMEEISLFPVWRRFILHPVKAPRWRTETLNMWDVGVKKHFNKGVFWSVFEKCTYKHTWP